jgi:hypothetical protein
MRDHNAVIQTEFTRLTGAKVTLQRNAFQQLVLEHEGGRWEKVRPMRPFPLSARDACVFFLDADGEQVGYVADAKELPADARALLEEELALLYFSTRINAIPAVKSRHGVTTWTLATERGEKVVHVKDRNDIRTLPGRRVIFTDTSGMRYEIANSDKLDDKSQGLLEAET